MAEIKRSVHIGDTLFIIGKYSLSPDEEPTVFEVQVAYDLNKRHFAYPKNKCGVFSFNAADFGKTVFWSRENAERVLRRYLDASD